MLWILLSLSSLLFGIFFTFIYVTFKRLATWFGFMSLFSSFITVIPLWGCFNPQFVGFQYFLKYNNCSFLRLLEQTHSDNDFIAFIIPKISYYTDKLFFLNEDIVINNLRFIATFFFDGRIDYFRLWYFYGGELIFAVDIVSILFILLTTFITPIILLVSVRKPFIQAPGLLILFLLFSQFLLIIAFCLLDFFYFFLAFESVLLPLFIIISFWGSRRRKIKAAFYFLMYTLLTSIGFLYVIFSLNYEIGSFKWFDLVYSLPKNFLLPVDSTTLTTLELPATIYTIPLNSQLICWLLLFLTLANKIPMFPFYLWLPEAHVEAPASGSIILAALLLKLGGYGFFRFLISALPQATYYFSPLVFSIALLSILFCSLTAVRCFDLKKIIAYSSIAHMNFAVLGLFSNNLYGIHGGILLLVGHGLVSCALFLLIGCLYERYNSRTLYYYGGLVQVNPIFSIIFFFFTLANISFPGTINFSAELLILTSIFFVNPLIYIILLLANVLAIIYAMWTFTRLCFGRLHGRFIRFLDLTRNETYISLYLLYLVLFFGVYPSPLLNSLYFVSLGVLLI